MKNTITAQDVADYLKTATNEEIDLINSDLFGGQYGTEIPAEKFIGITTNDNLVLKGEKPGQFPPIRR